MKNAFTFDTSKEEAKKENESARPVRMKKGHSGGQEVEQSTKADRWLESKTQKCKEAMKKS